MECRIDVWDQILNEHRGGLCLAVVSVGPHVHARVHRCHDHHRGAHSCGDRLLHVDGEMNDIQGGPALGDTDSVQVIENRVPIISNLVPRRKIEDVALRSACGAGELPMSDLARYSAGFDAEIRVEDANRQLVGESLNDRADGCQERFSC